LGCLSQTSSYKGLRTQSHARLEGSSGFINGFGKTDMNYQSGILVFVSSADWGAGGMVLLSLCDDLMFKTFSHHGYG
jgi:hypothetical protein